MGGLKVQLRPERVTVNPAPEEKARICQSGITAARQTFDMDREQISAFLKREGHTSTVILERTPYAVRLDTPSTMVQGWCMTSSWQQLQRRPKVTDAELLEWTLGPTGRVEAEVTGGLLPNTGQGNRTPLINLVLSFVAADGHVIRRLDPPDDAAQATSVVGDNYEISGWWISSRFQFAGPRLEDLATVTADFAGAKWLRVELDVDGAVTTRDLLIVP